MILITATKSNLTVCARETITSGSVQVYPVKFKFNSDWDGLVKTAVFKAGDAAVSVVLDGTNECNIPWEVLDKPDYVLEVGVYGVRGDAVVLPTIWGKLGTIQPGAQPGENAQEPTPTVYEQLMARLDEGRSAAQAAAEQAQADAAQTADSAAAAELSAADANDARAGAEAARDEIETMAENAPFLKLTGGTLSGDLTLNGNMTLGSGKILTLKTEHPAIPTMPNTVALAAGLDFMTEVTIGEELIGETVQHGDPVAIFDQPIGFQKGLSAYGSRIYAVANPEVDSDAANKYYVDTAVAAAVRQPYPNPETGTWWVWDAEKGEYADTGETYGGSGDGSISVVDDGMGNVEIKAAPSSWAVTDDGNGNVVIGG